MEKVRKPVSGYIALLVAIVLLGIATYLFTRVEEGILLILAIVLVVLSLFVMKGLMIIQPNHSRVLIFFGKYVGSVKDNGLFFVNPFYGTHRLSLRFQNLQGQTLKVNDKMGNPIEIAAVIVWQVNEIGKVRGLHTGNTAGCFFEIMGISKVN